MVTKQAPEALEEIAQSIVDAHKYETRAVGHEGCDACTEAHANAVAAIVSALRNERDRCAKVLETRADELQREWDAPPCVANGFIALTADTPAGYATYYAMNQFRKLAAAIRKGE